MEAEKQTEKTAGNPNTEGTTVQTDAPGQEPGMKLFAGDKVLWIIIAALAVISVLVVYSSTAKMAYDAHTARSTAHFLRQQLLILFRLRSADHHRTQDQLPDIQPPGAGRLCRQRSADAGRLFHRRHDQRRRPLDSARSFPVPAFRKHSRSPPYCFWPGRLAGRQSVIDKLRIIPSLNPLRWKRPDQRKIWREGTWPILAPRPALLCSDLPGPHLVGRAGLLRLVGDDAYRTGEDR